MRVDARARDADGRLGRETGGDGDHTEYAKHLRQPDEVGGFETQSVYVTVPDADAVFARAKARARKSASTCTTNKYGGRGGAFTIPRGTSGTWERTIPGQRRLATEPNRTLIVDTRCGLRRRRPIASSRRLPA